MSQEAPVATTEAPAAAPQHEGLFAPLVKVSQPSQTPDTNAPSSDDWYVMPGVKGEGARPDYLESKYQSMADQAKAYKDLASKLGMRAPENYDMSKYGEKIDTSNQHVASILTLAKQKHLGQDVVDGIFDVYSNMIDSSKVDYAKEVEKLGNGGRQKIETVANWASNTLSEGAIQTINKLGHTAEFINLLDELRQFQSHANQTTQPPGVTSNQSTPFQLETQAEIEQYILDHPDEYRNSAAFRAEVNARLRRALGE